MALGVKYVAFSLAVTASLSGLLWHGILARKHISIHASEFHQVNLPTIACAMAVGCTILVGEVYIIRDGSRPYDS
jgi:Na+/H+ antiporter NhaD/arsenite permease-like protein